MDKATMIEIKAREMNQALKEYYDAVELGTAIIHGEVAKIGLASGKIERIGRELIELTKIHE